MPQTQAKPPNQRANSRAKNHLRNNIASLAAVLLLDADCMKSCRCQLIEQFVRELVFIALQFACPFLGG